MTLSCCSNALCTPIFQACPLAVVVLDARCRVTFKWMSRITTSNGSSSSSSNGSNANINDRRHQYMNENDGHSSSSININSSHAPTFDVDKVSENCWPQPNTS
jgi:hypothetical protein